MTDEFYVGYQPKAPVLVLKFVRRVLAVLGGVVIGAGALLIVYQPSFAHSRFEFGIERDYEGVIATWPAPMLLTRGERYLLVAPGKFGLHAASNLEGRSVRLRGSLIQRGSEKVLEVVPESIRINGTGEIRLPERLPLGPVKLVGEIVDSKCYFGVMNPGERKVHRDCAVRCISGGIPPAFIVRDSSGQVRTLLLAAKNGKPLNQALLPFVAEPAEIAGNLIRSGAALVLETDPSSIRHTAGA